MTDTPTDSCLRRTGHKKSASGLVVYLMEELGDARLRVAQLKKYIKEATDLVEKSEHRDHLFEMAAHLIHGIPETVIKIDKALDAAALAAARLDYEEIKQGLRPEKVEELERVLQDARMRYLHKQSTERNAMKPREVAHYLSKLAENTEKDGEVPLAPLVHLIASLDVHQARIAGKKTASVSKAKAVEFFKNAAHHVATEPKPSLSKLAAVLRQVLADTIQQQAQKQEQAGAGEDFQKHNPGISDEEAKKIDEEHAKNKDLLKDKAKDA